jgi:signal transduction histidine kinase
MRLKTKLVLAITALVFLIAGVLSLVYVSQLLHAAVQQSYDTNHMVAEQVRFALQNALETGLKDQIVDPNNPYQLRNLVAGAVRSDAGLQGVVQSVNLYSLTVFDINIGDSQSSTLLSTNPDNEDRPLPIRPDYNQLLNARPIQLMAEVFGQPKVFDVVVPLDRNGKPFASVHVGVRTTLLRAVYAPWLAEAFTLMGMVLVTALVAAFLLSNLALRPMEEISRQLDFWTAASEQSGEKENTSKQDMAAQVSTKIEIIGKRIKNVEEVFSALKENLDQFLGNLQDGILLFTGDGRAVLVSQAARRFLQIDHDTILGLHAREIFDPSTKLGRTLSEAFESGSTLVQEEIRTETGRRIQASLDFIHDQHTRHGLGALVTLHDLESVEEIESELELSRRMAAIGRLTSGVGHEVKNPINAIVVHLELLKTKLGDASEPAVRHLEIIDAEIHRLDRVVQMLVDFTRPVDLELSEQDLRPVIGDVLTLATAELSTHNVTLTSGMPAKPLLANIDADLLKQAVLNVVQNGAQSMPEGGKLEVVLEEDPSHNPSSAVLRIADEGCGIPEEIREKIFDLYFTTKSGGSGIGLAMAYRILQLHHGSIEVQSKLDRGTEFQLRIPLTATEWGRRHLPPASVESACGMKFPARSVAWLLPLMLTACIHKTHKAPVQPLAPPVVVAPAPEPAPTVPTQPMLTIPTTPLATDAKAAVPPQEKPKPAVKHKKPVNKNAQQASNGNPGVSAIGQLSSGDPSDLRGETGSSIAATEHGLNNIGRRLDDQEAKTAVQIREFLKQARAALASGDIDGAHTLALKAKVLLGELSH